MEHEVNILVAKTIAKFGNKTEQQKSEYSGIGRKVRYTQLCNSNAGIHGAENAKQNIQMQPKPFWHIYLNQTSSSLLSPASDVPQEKMLY